MYCRYKCDNCGEWHGLEEFTMADLYMAMFFFLRDPPEPFDGKTWASVLAAEITRRRQYTGH